VSPIEQSRVLELLRGWLKPAVTPRAPRDPVLTFDMVAPPVREAWIGRCGVWVWHRVETAAGSSRVAAAIAGALARLQASEPAARIARTAWVMAIAALTNLLMLAAVERYHFPRRTALVFPLIVAIAAVLVGAMSPEIARAARDKRDQ
jgi:hypothetical protein